MSKTISISLFTIAVCCAVGSVDGKTIVGRANEPAHPLLIGIFSDWVNDNAAYIHGVDLDAPPSPEIVNTTPRVLENGWIEAEIPDTQPRARFGYKILGELENGVIVVMTQYDGGGSGRFQELLLLRVYRSEPVLIGSGERRILERIGSAVLGDRDSGKISIGPDSVTIGHSQHRSEEIILRVNPREE